MADARTPRRRTGEDAEVVLTESELDRLLAEAANKGARTALKELGLADEHAGADVRQLRDLLSSWRQVRKGALQSLGKMLVTLILLGLAYGAGHHFKGLP